MTNLNNINDSGYTSTIQKFEESFLTSRESVTAPLGVDEVSEIYTRTDYLEKRLLAVESVSTDWSINFENRINRIEKQYQDLNKEKEYLKYNIDLLSEIAQLQDNWNLYDAKKPNSDLIFKCLKIINDTELLFQPEIFPTANDSIQFEYEPDDDHYLEIEVFLDHIKLYKRIFDQINKVETISENEVFQAINDSNQNTVNNQSENINSSQKFDPTSEINDIENIYRVVRDWPKYWKKNGKISPAAFKDSKGLSADRDGDRVEEQVIVDFKVKRHFNGIIIRAKASKIKDINIILKPRPKYWPYHIIVIENENDLILSDEKCDRLRSIFTKITKI